MYVPNEFNGIDYWASLLGSVSLSMSKMINAWITGLTY